MRYSGMARSVRIIALVCGAVWMLPSSGRAYSVAVNTPSNVELYGCGGCDVCDINEEEEGHIFQLESSGRRKGGPAGTHQDCQQGDCDSQHPTVVDCDGGPQLVTESLESQ